MASDRATSPGLWTRREFVRAAAGLAAASGLKPAHAQQFAYVAGQDALHVFSVRGDRWTKLQQVTSRSPACVVLSKSQRTLYVANDVALYEGLARGTVETFHVDAADGRLTQSAIVPLSFSATRPRQMALSSDGRMLAVAAYGGGIYNLLPVGEDERLGRPEQIFKEVGFGTDAELQSSAHPHSLVFDGKACFLASDYGSDRVSGFSLQAGRLSRTMQRATGAGTGPGSFLLHSSAATLYVWHGLEPALVGYRYESGTVGDAIQRISFTARNAGAMGLHPSGRTLYLAQSGQVELLAWRVDLATGKLFGEQRVALGQARATQIVVSEDGASVYILNEGSIEKFTAYRATGALYGHRRVALLDAPQSMTLKTV